MGVIKTAIALILVTIFISGCVNQTSLASLVDKQLQGAPGYSTVKTKTLSTEEEKKVEEIIEKKIAEDPDAKEKLTENQQKKLKQILAEQDTVSEEDIQVLVDGMTKPTSQEILVQKWLDENKPVEVGGKIYQVSEITSMKKEEQQKLAEETQREEFEEIKKTMPGDDKPTEVYSIGGKTYGPEELSKMTEEELKELAKQLGLPIQSEQSKKEKK